MRDDNILEGSFLLSLRKFEEELSFETVSHNIYSPEHSLEVMSSRCLDFNEESLYAETLSSELSEKLLALYVVDLSPPQRAEEKE